MDLFLSKHLTNGLANSVSLTVSLANKEKDILSSVFV